MRIITRKTLDGFIKEHPQSGEQLSLIIYTLKKMFFENVNQVKEHFPNVSVLKDNRVVFNVHGNKYRLVLKFNYKMKTVFVRFIGTHAEYDKIDANTI